MSKEVTVPKRAMTLLVRGLAQRLVDGHAGGWRTVPPEDWDRYEMRDQDGLHPRVSELHVPHAVYEVKGSAGAVFEFKVFRAVGKTHADWGRLAMTAFYADWQEGAEVTGNLEMDDGPDSRDALRRLQMALEMRLVEKSGTSEPVRESMER